MKGNDTLETEVENYEKENMNTNGKLRQKDCKPIFLFSSSILSENP